MHTVYANGGYGPGNRKKEARKTDSRCSALAGQRPCPHVSMTAATECGYEVLPHPPYPTDLVLSGPKTEIPSSWFTLWKQ